MCDRIAAVRCSASVVVVLQLTSLSTTGEERLRIAPDVVYGHKAGMALTYDVIEDTAARNGAAVLFLASGGWFSGWFPPERFVSESTQERFGHFRRLLDNGYALVVVRHGSAPYFKVPYAVDDVRRAVRHFKQRAGPHGVDPDRLGVTGGSAGGHLSLMVGSASDDVSWAPNEEENGGLNPRVAAVAAYFPPVDLRRVVGPSESFPALDFDSEDADDVSPIVVVSSNDAPMLLIHGDQDDLVPLENSREIYAAFNERRVDCKLIILEGAGHGFAGENGRKASEALVN